jgi:hypothetical protein
MRLPFLIPHKCVHVKRVSWFVIFKIFQLNYLILHADLTAQRLLAKHERREKQSKNQENKQKLMS